MALTLSRPRSSADEPRRPEVERAGGAGAADAVKRGVGDDLLAAGKHRFDVMAVGVVDGLDARHLFAEAERHAVFAKVVAEGLDDFAVDERQQAIALVDQRDAHAQRRKDAGILNADHARAHHRQGARELLEPHDIVADEDALPVKRDARIAAGTGADGQHDVGRRYVALSASVADQVQADRMGIDKCRLGVDQLDAVAQELMAGDVDLVADDVLGAEEQVAHRDVLLDCVRRAVDARARGTRRGAGPLRAGSWRGSCRC